MHGCSYIYNSSYRIYVDKSLEENSNLETLASDIIAEKQSDKYKRVYQFDAEELQTFKNSKTENVKIGEIETVFFESEELEGKSAFGEGIKTKIIGYSFVYNKQYISVYGQLLVEENGEYDNLVHMLQYIINSIKTFKGESIQELVGNVKDYYDDGNCINNLCINYYSPHVRNGILATKGRNKTFFDISDFKNAFNSWDKTLEGILKSTENIDDESFRWSGKKQSYEILNQENTNINGIDMKKYVLKVSSGSTMQYYYVVYTFIYDNKTYLFQYTLSNSIYDGFKYKSGTTGIYIKDMTKEQSDLCIKQTETVADAFICTIRKIKSDSNEEYCKYIKIF